MWKINILTLFPEIYPGPLKYSTPGKAMDAEHWELNTKNIRDFATSKHKTVDSPPFGGGGGMPLRADVLGIAIESFFSKRFIIILHII